jgi:hypothetical protein
MAMIELVVEEVLPTERVIPVCLRVRQYLRAGVQAVCLLYPEEQAMSVHRAGHGPEYYEAADEVPELNCRVAEFLGLPGRQP